MMTNRIVVHLNLAELVVTEVLSSSQSGRQDGQASDTVLSKCIMNSFPLHGLHTLPDSLLEISNSNYTLLIQSIPVRKEPRSTVELSFGDLNLTLEHTVVVGVGIVEVEVALAAEEAVPVLGGEPPD